MFHHLGGFLSIAIGITGGILLLWFAWLRYRQDHEALVIRQFRAALTILINTMREGRAIEQAVSVLADLGPSPLNHEFRELDSLAQNQAGRPALIAELLQRFPCFEAEYLATALECFPEAPEDVAARLAELEQNRTRRESSKTQVASACRAARFWIRGLLLSGPIAMAAIGVLNPEVFLDFRSRLGSSSSVLMMIGGLFIIAVWFVLILQKQDESEIVFD